MMPEKTKHSAIDPELAKIRSEINKIARDVKWEFGLNRKHVESGKEVAIDADKIFPLGSVFKIPVMMEVYRQASEGIVSLYEKLRLAPRYFLIRSGLVYYSTTRLD